MATDLTPERVAELRRLIAGNDDHRFVSAADPVWGNDLTFGELRALLAAAEERDRLRAQRDALVAALEGILRITDRDHVAWHAAHAAIRAAKEATDG